MSNQRRESKPLRALGIKLHNARVEGGLMADGSVRWLFRRLSPGRLIEYNRIRISQEAMFAMQEINRRLTKPEDPQ